MIECIRGTGGCNGWVHPGCCGLILTQEELEAIDSYICPLCEKPTDDYSTMKALNTQLANRLATKQRKKKLLAQAAATAKAAAASSAASAPSSSSKSSTSSSSAKKGPWTCSHCGTENADRSTSTCSSCRHRRKSSKSSASISSSRHKKSDKKTKSSKSHSHRSHHDDDKAKGKIEDDDAHRRSSRDANKKKKSYHVPNSDDGFSSEDDDERHHMSKSGKKKKKRRREDGHEDRSHGLLDDDDSDTDSDTISGKQRKKPRATEAVDTGSAPPSMVIEKIMGVRKREIPVENPSLPDINSAVASVFAPSRKDTMQTVTEYYIKWKHFSHLHCSWETKEILLEIDPNNKMRIKRFHEKEQHPHHHHHHHHHKTPFDDDEMPNDDDEREYFNPEYLEIHRVIAHRKEEPMANDPAFPDAPKDDGMRYLVKWRVLPYTDATWERACDLKDDSAIEKYWKALTVPPKEQWEPRPRPTLREYRKLEESPLFGQDQTLSLRAYQLEGLNWLLWNWYNERPSILADEMGLGKTIQTLSFLDRLRFSEKIMCRGPFLIVAPLSLIVQWQNECETWTTMNCIVYHGNSEAREKIREHEFYFLDSHNQPDKKKPFRFHILVTTYEVAIKDISILSKIRWRCLVVDEAHRLKNQASRLVEQLRSIRRDHCVLLTGTPLQNKTEELWALLNFLDAKSFPSVEDFLAKFGDLHEAQQVADLHKMLKPYLLRRVKEDVEKSLPPKEETIIEVELTPVQKQWYRAIYEKNTTFLNRARNPHNIPNLMNVMMELRKCCNHPYLNNGVEEILNEGLVSEAQRHEMMVKCCGKMVLIDKLLPRLKEGGHKVLIFSQMVRVLDIIEDYLRYMGYVFERLDGNIRGNDRQAAVDRFVKPEYNRFVMLLSTKAGGLGLNLTAADTVIIFDSDWNPQNDLQAQARAHRIGQTHSVKIYRLITRKTYEMHMFHKASLKLGLDKAVLTHMRRENEDLKDGKKKLSKAEESKEIDELLKRGAYDVFRDDDSAGEQFCAADIDQILQRSAQVVQYEQQAQSSFSKASFVAASTSDDVDIDDPDFWKKAVGLTEPDPSESADNLPLQRKRTRVARFGTSNGYDSDGADEDEIEKKEKEAERKEREREKEAERERLEEKREPRDWTLNGRDRLQRALMHFGFGRWEIIRSQSGGSRSLEEVERFAREFMYVCGLSCTDTAGSKDDSGFVKSAIRAAGFAQKERLVDEDELPPVLKDEEFLVKLKQGGGRRVLIRLDMLLRLQRLVTAACDLADGEYYAQPEQAQKSDETTDDETMATTRRPPPARSADVDERVNYHGVDKISSHMELIDVGDRPSWTAITPWWDELADRNLLIGVFLHGYGRCAQIIGDPRLCFAKLEAAAREEEAAVAPSSEASESALKTEKKSEDAAMSDGGDSDNETSTVNGDDDEAEVKSVSSAAAATSTPDSSAAVASVKKEPSAEAESNTDKKFKQPEVQQMNRLLFWLLSADDIKRQKELDALKKERVAVEQQRQASLEKKQRASTLHHLEVKAQQLAHVDVLRHVIVLHNAGQVPDPVIAQKIKQKDWTKDERRSFSYMMALYGAPRILAKSALSAASPQVQAAGLSARGFAWETDSVSWMNIVQWGRLNKTAALARAFYEDKFLPKCYEIANMKADPLGTDQRAVALADLIGIEFVDAHEGVLAHGLKARSIAWMTLRRTQLLEDVCTVLSSRLPQLVSLLRSGREQFVKDMPVWWCPWVHDLGVFYGMARYGVYGWERTLLDRQLPFRRQAREQHIRSVFLDGTSEMPPLYRDLLESPAGREQWLARVMAEFPSLSVLEAKVQAICAELLEHESYEDEDTEMREHERYEEPEKRKPYSLPRPRNCFEEFILQRVAVQDAPTQSLVPASVTDEQERAALVQAFASSQSRRDEYLRQALGRSQSPPAALEAPANAPAERAASQVSIEMLVS